MVDHVARQGKRSRDEERERKRPAEEERARGGVLAGARQAEIDRRVPGYRYTYLEKREKKREKGNGLVLSPRSLRPR